MNYELFEVLGKKKRCTGLVENKTIIEKLEDRIIFHIPVLYCYFKPLKKKKDCLRVWIFLSKYFIFIDNYEYETSSQLVLMLYFQENIP